MAEAWEARSPPSRASAARAWAQDARETTLRSTDAGRSATRGSPGSSLSPATSATPRAPGNARNAAMIAARVPAGAKIAGTAPASAASSGPRLRSTAARRPRLDQHLIGRELHLRGRLHPAAEAASRPAPTRGPQPRRPTLRPRPRRRTAATSLGSHGSRCREGPGRAARLAALPRLPRRSPRPPSRRVRRRLPARVRGRSRARGPPIRPKAEGIRSSGAPPGSVGAEWAVRGALLANCLPDPGKRPGYGGSRRGATLCAVRPGPRECPRLIALRSV